MSFSIYIEQGYFADTLNAPKDGAIRDPLAGDVIAVATQEEAQQLLAAIDRQNGGEYILSHGQHSSPSYRVVSSKAPAVSLKEAAERLFLELKEAAQAALQGDGQMNQVELITAIVEGVWTDEISVEDEVLGLYPNYGGNLAVEALVEKAGQESIAELLAAPVSLDALRDHSPALAEKLLRADREHGSFRILSDGYDYPVLAALYLILSVDDAPMRGADALAQLLDETLKGDNSEARYRVISGIDGKGAEIFSHRVTLGEMIASHEMAPWLAHYLHHALCYVGDQVWVLEGKSISRAVERGRQNQLAGNGLVIASIHGVRLASRNDAGEVLFQLGMPVELMPHRLRKARVA